MPRKKPETPAPSTVPGVAFRDGKWHAHADVSRPGQPRRQRHRTFADRVSAETWKLETDAARRLGLLADAGGLTVRDLCERYLAMPGGRLAPSTIRHYRAHLARHVYPTLGRTPADRLRPLAAQAHFDRLLAAGVSPKTAAEALKPLRGAFRLAVAWELLPRNPVELVSLPPIEPARPRLVPEPADVRTLLADPKPHPLDAPLWRVLAATGLRLGEALALAWAEVDLERGSLRVSRHLSEDEDGAPVLMTGAKTGAGVRTVRLDGETVAILRGHRDRQRFRREAYGPDWVELGLVFDAGDGSARTEDAIRSRLRSDCRRLGIPAMHPHALRHHQGSVLAAAGVPVKVAQERLGHKSSATTLDIYTHVLGDGQAAAAEAVAAVLAGVQPSRGEAEGSNRGTG